MSLPSFFPITFASPSIGGAASLLVLAAAVVVIIRRPDAPKSAWALLGLGTVALAFAAAGTIWRRPAAGELAVMVDLSPSTRTATYRNRAALTARIEQLVGPVPFRVEYFADGTRAVDATGSTLADLPAERTVYVPPAADAVLLFTDAQFDPPGAGPPTYVVVDPRLEDPPDAAVTSLEIQGGHASIPVVNSGRLRSLTLGGTVGMPTAAVPTGSVVIERPVAPGATGVSATLSPGDAWPENDSLAAPAPPTSSTERWWVGKTAPPAGAGEWKVIDHLPGDPAAWLAPSLIVLADVPASDIGDARQILLHQYLHDLGGGLLILGGEHAFAAGGYPGTPLESLSPLSSMPPHPTTHWMLLADASGSMNDAAGNGSTRWRTVVDAIGQLLPALPPDDLVSVGGFAQSLAWWSWSTPVRQTLGQPLPPAGVHPSGPTNLEDALNAIAGAAEPALPKQLVLLTDADAEIKNPAALSAALRRKNIRLDLLAIGNGDEMGLAPLRQVVSATGGKLLEETDAHKWADSLQKLMRSVSPRLLGLSDLSVTFLGDLSTLPGLTVSPWNRTWLKDGATPLAEASSDDERITPAARWDVGEGRVLAAGFSPAALSPATLGRLADAAAQPPRDPRFQINWETGSRLHVLIDAVDPTGTHPAYLNHQPVILEVSPADATGAPADARPIPQTGPGRYELSLPAPRRPALAAVGSNGRVLDRIAVPGRYAPEFEAIGNNHEAMHNLADATGGAVIDARTTGPIPFHWPARDVPLTPWMAAAGSLLIAMGLLRWRTQ